MPWRRRTIKPLSHRFHIHSETTRSSLVVESCRVPRVMGICHQPVWDILALNAKARANLREMEHLADGWVVRWPGETEAFGVVVRYSPWPADLRIRLHDKGRDGMDTGADEMQDCFQVLAATRHSASATWGGSAAVGFLQLADEVWGERERIAAPDMDALESLIL